MSDTTEPVNSYFTRTAAHRFAPTPHVGGAWSDQDQHFSPLAGLVVHEIERHRAHEKRPAMLISRIQLDILGRIPFDEFEIHTRTPRPGRTIELSEATVFAAGKSIVNARVWLMRPIDTTNVEGGQPNSLPEPDSLATWRMSSVWPGGYVESIDVRRASKSKPGRAAAWVTTSVDLVANETASRVASYVALVDTANGIAVRQNPASCMFPNLDLSIHLYRQPVGQWTGLDTTVVFGPAGQGLTSTVLHDIRGPIGAAQQILTVRPGGESAQ